MKFIRFILDRFSRPLPASAPEASCAHQTIALVRTDDTVARIEGSLVGAIVGDALGVPVEGQSRSSLAKNPVCGMRAGCRWGMPAGTWSDDGALILASAAALTERYDLPSVCREFESVLRESKWTATGDLFDIGRNTRFAICEMARGRAPALCGGREESDNGNGALMRIAPFGLRLHGAPQPEIFVCGQEASAITHAHPRSQVACALFLVVLDGLVRRQPLPDAIASAFQVARETLCTEHLDELNLYGRLESPSFDSLPDTEIDSGGYVVETLEAAVWCLSTTSSFPSAVLKAVNLGHDADTTACVTGALAGARYGRYAIPTEWVSALSPRGAPLAVIKRFARA